MSCWQWWDNINVFNLELYWAINPMQTSLRHNLYTNLLSWCTQYCYIHMSVHLIHSCLRLVHQSISSLKILDDSNVYIYLRQVSKYRLRLKTTPMLKTKEGMDHTTWCQPRKCRVIEKLNSLLEVEHCSVFVAGLPIPISKETKDVTIEIIRTTYTSFKTIIM